MSSPDEQVARLVASPLPQFDRDKIRAQLTAAMRDDNAWRMAAGDLAVSQQIAKDSGVPPPLPRQMENPNLRIKPTETVAAAVLVPLIERDGDYTVLLTQRTADLKKHSGQVAFPGGRMDPEDLDAEGCALREAWEETRLDPASVEILGRLGSWVTGTGYHITPIVGAVTPPLNLRPQPGEVAAVFEVPLAFFLDPANHRRVSVDYQGTTRHFYEMPYGDRYIWGATAGMLLNLYYALIF